MSRTLTTAMRDAVTADVVRPVLLIRMVFDTAPLHVWNGVGDLTFSSNTYSGLGDLISISTIEETSDISASGINVVLTGLKSSFLSTALNEDYQGRVITVHLGGFDASGSLIADPIIIFTGFMDVMTITEAGDSSTISIACENKLIALERSKERRYTPEDQKIDFPNDKGFEFVADTSKQEIIWGGRSTPIGVYGGSGNTSDPSTQGAGNLV